MRLNVDAFMWDWHKQILGQDGSTAAPPHTLAEFVLEYPARLGSSLMQFLPVLQDRFLSLFCQKTAKDHRKLAAGKKKSCANCKSCQAYCNACVNL